MTPNLILGSAISFLAACGPSAEEKSKQLIEASQNRFEQAMSDSLVLDAPAYLISEHSLKGKTNKLVNKVEFLEMYTKQKMGYVEKSEINREILDQKEIRISQDTSAKITNYRLVADLTLRIPYYALDSTLLLCSSMMDYVDYRGISNVNAETEMISNLMNQASEEKMIEENQKLRQKYPLKPSIEMNTQEKTEQHRVAANQARVADLQLKENILYGTLHVSLYEDEQNQVEKSFMLKEIKPYEPNTFMKLAESMKEGARGLEKIILFIFSIWEWILLGWLSYKAYYKWRKHFRKSISNNIPA